MKRSIIITAISLLISAGLTAQVSEQTQQQIRKQDGTRVQNQTRVQDGSGLQIRSKMSGEEKKLMRNQGISREKANHGRIISETAKNTESGPGKGEVVSNQAKNQGQIQQARIRQHISANNRPAYQGAIGNTIRNRAKVCPGAGAGHK